VSFQTTEREDWHATLDQPGRVLQHSAYQKTLSPTSPNPETGFTMADAALEGRKKALVQPDWEKIEPGHQHWHYCTHTTILEDANANLIQLSSVFSILFHYYLS